MVFTVTLIRPRSSKLTWVRCSSQASAKLSCENPRAVRISRILAEENPALANFDGETLARERVYQDRDVDRGIALFARTRAANLAMLRRVEGPQWKRSGSQEGIGCVTLADIPRMMAEHDRSHGDEIADLLALTQGQPRSAKPRGSSAVA